MKCSFGQSPGSLNGADHHNYVHFKLARIASQLVRAINVDVQHVVVHVYRAAETAVQCNLTNALHSIIISVAVGAESHCYDHLVSIMTLSVSH